MIADHVRESFSPINNCPHGEVIGEWRIMMTWHWRQSEQEAQVGSIEDDDNGKKDDDNGLEEDGDDGKEEDDDEHVVLLVITEEKMVREKIYAVLPFKITKTPPQH